MTNANTVGMDMSTKQKTEVCPTCKRTQRQHFSPTKHAKVKATYGSSRGIYWAYRDKHRPHHYPAFKAKVSNAPYYTRGWRNSNRTSMSCPDEWHIEQLEKSLDASDAKIKAKETAEEDRKKFLAERKERKAEAAEKRKAKARLHKERQKKK